MVPTTFMDDSSTSVVEDLFVDYEYELSRFLREQSSNARMGAPSLKIKRYIKSEDEDHHLFHQDGLDRKKAHYHVEFQNDIDKDSFAEILQELLNGELITDVERERITRSYAEAVDLRQEPVRSSPVSTVRSTMFSAIQSPSSSTSPSPRTPMVKTSSFSGRFFDFARAMAQTPISPMTPFFPKMPS